MMRKVLFVWLWGAVLVPGCTPRNYMADMTVSTYRIDGIDDPEPAADIDRVIEPYRSQLEVEMNEVVGEVEVSMDKALPAGGLNNWFADALLQSAQVIFGRSVDVAIQNYGGLRLNNIGPGPITRGKIFELMPFENLSAIVRLDSIRIQAICDDLASFGGGAVSHTLQFGIQDDKAHQIRIRGEELRAGKEYWFYFPDYVINGGDIGEIVAGAERHDQPVLVRDGLLMELQRLRDAGEKVRGVPDGRIYFINE